MPFSFERPAKKPAPEPTRGWPDDGTGPEEEAPTNSWRRAVTSLVESGSRKANAAPRRPTGRLSENPDLGKIPPEAERRLAEGERERVSREIHDYVELIIDQRKLSPELASALRAFATEPENGDLLLRPAKPDGHYIGQELTGHGLRNAYLQLLALSRRLRNLDARIRKIDLALGRPSDPPVPSAGRTSGAYERPRRESPANPPLAESSTATLRDAWTKTEREITDIDRSIRARLAMTLASHMISRPTKEALLAFSSDLELHHLTALMNDPWAKDEIDRASPSGYEGQFAGPFEKLLYSATQLWDRRNELRKIETELRNRVAAKRDTDANGAPGRPRDWYAA